METADDKEHLNDDGVKTKTRTCHMFVLSITFVVICVAGIACGLIYVISRICEPIHPQPPAPCQDPCVFTLVESIPENLTYSNGSLPHPSTFTGISQLLDMAQDTIEIASFYWSMRGSDLPSPDGSSWQGEALFDSLMKAGKEKKVKIRIVQSKPDKPPVADTVDLAKNAGAEVRTLDFSRLQGYGILHTKMWLIDRKHFYVGSANLDWRSFTQVKEMGAVISECSCMAEDIGKIFGAYWYLAEPTSKIPSVWPPSFDTKFNNNTPMEVSFNGTRFQSYMSSSPPTICPNGRSHDGQTIVEIIKEAEEFIHIAVMDYFPTTQFTKPRYYWPNIDDALRAAAFNKRNVRVKLLASYWNHTWDNMFMFLRSLDDLRKHFNSYSYGSMSIEVKMFVVPAVTEAQKNIPFSRVNHNKYMVTDKKAYIGTSNWSADYFIYTGGIGLVVSQPRGGSGNVTVDIRQQLADVFDRDWYSEHAFYLDQLNVTQSPTLLSQGHTEL